MGHVSTSILPKICRTDDSHMIGHRDKLGHMTGHRDKLGHMDSKKMKYGTC